MSVPTFSVTARSGDVLLGLSCVNEEHEAAAYDECRSYDSCRRPASSPQLFVLFLFLPPSLTWGCGAAERTCLDLSSLETDSLVCAVGVVCVWQEWMQCPLSGSLA